MIENYVSLQKFNTQQRIEGNNFRQLGSFVAGINELAVSYEMKTEELIYNNPDLEGYLSLFEDSKNYILSSNGNTANIQINSCGLHIELSLNDLSLLSKGEQIRKSGYTHLNHCGFTYKNYGEISVIVVPSSYAFTKES